MRSKLLKLAGIAALAIMAGGCGTPPTREPPTYELPSFPETKLPEPDERSAVLVVYRKWAAPIAFSVTAKLNGKVVAALPVNTFTMTRVEPGAQTLTMEWPFLAMQSDQRQVLNVEPGKHYFVEFSGGFRIILGVLYAVRNLGEVNRDQAMEELQSCCRHVPSRP